MKRIMSVVTLFFMLVSFSGCAALVVGAVAGGGTALWLSGKLSQEVDGSYDKTVKATESALKSLKLPVEEKNTGKEVTQIISKYTDGSKVWIDIRPVSAKKSKVEVRVGMNGNKEASRKILNKIERYL